MYVTWLMLGNKSSCGSNFTMRVGDRKQGICNWWPYTLRLCYHLVMPGHPLQTHTYFIVHKHCSLRRSHLWITDNQVLAKRSCMLKLKSRVLSKTTKSTKILYGIVGAQKSLQCIPEHVVSTLFNPCDCKVRLLSAHGRLVVTFLY